MEETTGSKRLTPGRELAVLATLRQTSARELAHRSGMPEWRVSRILAGTAKPTDVEMDRLRAAMFAHTQSTTAHTEPR